MHGERPSWGNRFWNDAIADLLNPTCETTDTKTGESQCQTFCHSVDSGTHHSLCCKSVIENVNGVDETCPKVQNATCSTFLRHLLNGEKAQRQFLPDFS